jgi:hypothetical protein
MKDRKLATIALAFAFSLSSTFALANMVRHKPNVRAYYLHRDISLVRSRSLHPNYGNPHAPNQCIRGRIHVERKERLRVGRRLIWFCSWA